ncbi:hypothetical protein T10_5172, partial [Trichinella papuae]
LQILCRRLAKPVPIFQQQLCTNFVLQSGLHLPQLQLWTVFYLYKPTTLNYLHEAIHAFCQPRLCFFSMVAGNSWTDRFRSL